MTCDVGIHHVHLIDRDVGDFDPNFRLDPPLRGSRDRDAIRAALADGTIDAICSDHAPIDEDAKMLPFEEAAPGATALETLLPLVLKWADETKLPLVRALAAVTSGPARVLGEPTGRLAAGAKADLCIFDPQWAWRVGPEALVSHGKNTPFAGEELLGRARATLVGGELRFEKWGQTPIPEK